MELNWITIVAQMLNLFLLVYLLNRYLFGPITSVMAEREDRIKAGLGEGRQMLAKGERMADEYDQKVQDLEQEKEEILAQAQQRGEDQRETILQEAREEAEDMRRRLRDELEQEEHQLLSQLQDEIIDHACRLAQTLLEELSDTGLEARSLCMLISRLETAEGQQVELLRANLDRDGCVVVTTGRELSPGGRAEVQEALEKVLGPHQPRFEFRVSPTLIFGVTIETGGAHLEWNAADYLRRIEEDAREQLLSAERTLAGDEDG